MVKEDKCYKLCLDINKIDLNMAFVELAKVGDFTLFDGSIYIWLNQNNSKNSLLAKLKKMHITECYCQGVSYHDVMHRQDFLAGWYVEHYDNERRRELEEQEQDKLKKMLSNIEKATQLLREREQQSTQQAVNAVEEKNNKA